MLGDSVPDKPLLAIWLQPPREAKQSAVIDPQQAKQQPNPTGGKGRDETEGFAEGAAHSQRDDELVGGAGDHGPGAGVDGVDVPQRHDPLLVPQPALHRHQRRHCSTSENCSAPATP